MALMTLNTRSKSLGITIDINIIIPDMDNTNVTLSNLKVLYLLHGYSDNSTMWLRRTKIEEYSEKHHVIVVMPSCANSYYMNSFGGCNYEDFIVYELPSYLEMAFGFTNKKEYKMIAGLSMGGGGAMRIGLKHHDKYFAVGSFSGTLVYLKDRFENITDMQRDFYICFRKVIDDIENSEVNTLNLIKPLDDMKLIYSSCGKNDSLYDRCLMFENVAKEKGMKLVTYYEDNIGHSWDFWDREVNHFLSLALAE